MTSKRFTISVSTFSVSNFPVTNLSVSVFAVVIFAACGTEPAADSGPGLADVGPLDGSADAPATGVEDALAPDAPEAQSDTDAAPDAPAAEVADSASSDPSALPDGQCGSTADCATDEYCDWRHLGGAGCPDEGLGLCSPRPLTCPPSLPGAMCGCDGNVYPSKCEAARAGTASGTAAWGSSPCAKQPEGAACGWSVRCQDGLVCLSDAGGCDGYGVCAAPPTDCAAADPTPVCGCDLLPYASACEALQHLTLTVPDPWSCRNLKCQSNADCDPTAFCQFNPSAVCGAFGPGYCRARETGDCAGTYTQCGCDGVTYPSVCEASKAGATIAYDYTCGDPRRPCYGIAGECAADEYCLFNAEGGCIVPGESFEVGGVCTTRPTVCQPGSPACGCDGVTYGSACLAAQAGVFAVAGACPVP